MQVIATVNTKGGSGKTTLAACLGVIGANDGLRVALCDTDPQSSLSYWHADRNPPGTEDCNPGLLRGEDVASEAVEKLLLTSPYDLVIVDGPPGSILTTEDAIAAADLALIPMRPTALDLRASQDCIHLCRQHGTAHLVVFNGVTRYDVSMLNEARKSLKRLKVPVCAAHIAQRMQFANQMTKGMTGPEADAKAAKEIKNVWAEVEVALKASRRVREVAE